MSVTSHAISQIKQLIMSGEISPGEKLPKESELAIIPLYDVRLSVRVPEKVEEVVRVPEDKLLDFEQKDGRVELVLPRLDGHQMIALDIAEQRA